MYMSEITRKKNTGEPGNGGEFGHRVKNNSGTGLGATEQDCGGKNTDEIMPNGLTIGLHMEPARDVFTPVTKTDSDGNFVTYYVGIEEYGKSEQPMLDHGRILDTYDIEYAHEEMSARDLVREHCFQTGDLDRAILLTKISDNPVQYEGKPVGNDFYDDGGDEDEWKYADAAFIVPEDRADEGFETWVDEINQAAYGKSYTVVVHKTSPSGQLIGEYLDSYDDTLVDADDATARMEAHLDGRMGDLDEFFE